MWVPISMPPEVAIDANELQDLIVNNRVLAEIQKDKFGLPQAGSLAYDQLVEHLESTRLDS
jgi:hypothetical protein